MVQVCLVRCCCVGHYSTYSLLCLVGSWQECWLFNDWTTYFYHPSQGLSSVLVVKVQSHFVFAVVVCVIFCLGLKILFVDYVSGDSNVFPPAFGYDACMFSIFSIKFIREKKKRMGDLSTNDSTRTSILSNGWRSLVIGYSTGSSFATFK